MKIFRTITPGTCGMFYQGGCDRCGYMKGRNWPFLPAIIDTPELYLIGHLCLECHQILETSRDERCALIRYFEKEGIKCEEVNL